MAGRPRQNASPSPLEEIADGPEEDRHFVTALARGLEVLACFRRGEALLGNQEIAARCGLPKSTVSRLTHTLTRLGYLHHLPELGKYRLGTAVLALGSSMLARLDVRRLARPLMQELADHTRAVVALGMRDRNSMLYLERARGDAAVSVSLEVGSRISIATSAMGRAYLAICPALEREAVLARFQELDAAAWPRIRDGVQQAMLDMQRLGCVCSFGEWQKDVNAIAIGFHPGGGMPPMVVNCGAPSFLVSPEYLLEEARPRLAALVQRLEGCMDPDGGMR
jgi:DNA-binding IclR family transcriptional regulator